MQLRLSQVGCSVIDRFVDLSGSFADAAANSSYGAIGRPTLLKTPAAGGAAELFFDDSGAAGHLTADLVTIADDHAFLLILLIAKRVPFSLATKQRSCNSHLRKEEADDES